MIMYYVHEIEEKEVSYGHKKIRKQKVTASRIVRIYRERKRERIIRTQTRKDK